MLEELPGPVRGLLPRCGLMACMTPKHLRCFGCRRALVSAALLILVLSACGKARGPSSIGTAKGPGATRTWPVAERKPVPSLTGELVDGSRLDTARLRGSVVVLNVWGSWCGPCRGEAPNLKKVSDEYAARGVRFVGIDIRDTRANATAFEASFGITYPSFFDPTGLLVVRLNKILPAATVPVTLVVDRQGRAAARGVGGLTEAQLRAIVDPAAAEAAS